MSARGSNRPWDIGWRALRQGVRLGRGLLGLGLLLSFMAIPVALALYLVLVPACRVVPARRLAWTSAFLMFVSRGILELVRLGGARYRRTGELRTDEPGLVLMNHQSLLDIPVATVMSRPLAPSFVSHAFYSRVPLVGTALEMLGCHLVDARADAEGALATLRRAAREERMLLIYPEGHRSRDGELQPFRPAGVLAILGERRLPVWLIVTDGFSAGRGLAGLGLRAHLIRGQTEVLGPFTPPEDGAALPSFLDWLHATMAEAQTAMRAGAPEH